jgi:hypothetical protein
MLCSKSKGLKDNMPIKLKVPLFFLMVIVAAVLGASMPGWAVFKKHIKGSIKGDVYTSPGKEFRVAVPVDESAGGAVRDEQGKDVEISQVIFTDDFGSFYRIVCTKTSRSVDEMMGVFHDIRDKKTTEGPYGRELRVIDVEPEGSEMTITTIKPGSSTEVVRPDLITANVLFSMNGRIYHVVAGYMAFRDKGVEREQQMVISRLEQFLAGFQPLENGKPIK